MNSIHRVHTHSLRGCLDFFFCYHSSLLTQFSSLITHHLKYPNFPKPTHFGTHHSVLPLLFVSKKKKTKSQTLRLNSERVVSLITKMLLETELWKLKTFKMCFQFPKLSFHNSSLKNQRIEWWKQNPNGLLNLGSHHFRVMSYGNRVMSYWKSKSKQPFNLHFF